MSQLKRQRITGEIPAARASPDELAERYLGLVIPIARSFQKRLPSSVDFDDLVGAGNLGLVEAARRFTREDFERKVTPHWIGRVVRRKLGLKTEKRHGSYVVAATEGPKLARLFEKYGVSTGQGDLGDSGDFAGGEETAAPSTNQPII